MEKEEPKKQEKPLHLAHKRTEPKKRENTIVAIDTPIPEMPKEILKPIKQEEYAKKEEDIYTLIDAKYDDLRKYEYAAYEKYGIKFEDKKTYIEEKKNTFTIIKDANSKISSLNATKIYLRNQLEVINEELGKGLKKCPYGLGTDFEVELKGTDKQLISGTNSKQKENELINKLESLKKFKDVMPKYCALSKKAEEIKASLKPIGAELKKLYDIKDKCKAKIEEYTKKLEGFFNSQKMLKTENDELKKQRDSVHEEIAKLKEDAEHVWDEFYKKQDQYYEQQRLIKTIDYIKRKKERLEKQKEYDDRHKTEEAEREKERSMFKKHQQEIDDCTFLKKFLQKYLNESVPAEEQKPDEAAIERKKKMEVLVKKGDLIPYSKVKENNNMSKTKKKKEKKQKAKTEISLDPHVISLFAKYTLQIPYNVEVIKSIIPLIDSKIKEYERLSEEAKNPSVMKEPTKVVFPIKDDSVKIEPPKVDAPKDDLVKVDPPKEPINVEPPKIEPPKICLLYTSPSPRDS